jgi:hypothetical protein
MKKQHITELESRLEQLIEGAFTNLFGKRLQAQDIALQLARAMQDGTIGAQPGDSHPLAPDEYLIYTHSAVQKRLLEKTPNLTTILSGHMLELATLSGYRLNNVPSIKLLADPAIDMGSISVQANFSEPDIASTAALKRVELPQIEKPKNAQLIINDLRAVPLEYDIINIGRQDDNHVVVDDPYVSRHHLQLRLRYGAYTLFDVRQKSDTYVNGILVREHHLRTGDVIRIGGTEMIYMQDDGDDGDGGQTQPTEPIL